VTTPDGHEQPERGLDVRITAGGRTDPIEQAAIVMAVSRLVKAREVERAKPTSAWALAGRLEASGATTVRWRGALPVGPH
jgi:hypothetical protein